MSNEKDANRPAAMGHLKRDYGGNWTILQSELEAKIQSRLEFLPDYGVWHLTVMEAAELIALDRFNSGELPEIEFPDDDDTNGGDIKSLLSDETDKMYKRLCAAISSGSLKAMYQRDLDEKIDFDHAYVQFQDLDEWLSERNCFGGDDFEEWESRAASQAAAMADHAYYLRRASRDGRLWLQRIAASGFLRESDGSIRESASLEELRAALQAAYVAIDGYRAGIELAEVQENKQIEKPLKGNERNSLLTIIAALCDYSAINFAERGASVQISAMTDSIGASVSDDTVRRLLAKIPGALEARSKK